METNKIALEDIKKVYRENTENLQEKFLKLESSFLSQVYNRYNKDLDNGVIILNFSSEAHRSILRVRENDLFHDISFNNFWSNCESMNDSNLKIVTISKKTDLPKETARRKINQLVDDKILFLDKDKKIFWKPTLGYKKTYNELIEIEINEIDQFIEIIGKHLKISMSKDKIVNEIKKHFSFYWYHYLNSQLLYLKNWQKKFKDLELFLIGIECLLQMDYSDTKTFSITSNTISDITGIPRSTCIRKLETLTKLKFIKKNTTFKKYFIEKKNIYSNSSLGKEVSNAVIENFCYLFLLVIRGTNRQT